MSVTLPPRPPLPEPPERGEDVTDEEWDTLGRERFEAHDAAYRSASEKAWKKLSKADKFEWAESHDIGHVEIDGVVFNVATRERIGPVVT